MLTWDPKPDITLHELALCMPILLANAAGWTKADGIEKILAALPPNAARHFGRS